MTAEAKVHAQHLRTLLREARVHLDAGEEIPESLWAQIEEVAEMMEAAL